MIMPLNESPKITLGVLRVFAQKALEAETLRHTSKMTALDDPIESFKYFMRASEIDVSGFRNLGPRWEVMCIAIKN